MRSRTRERGSGWAGGSSSNDPLDLGEVIVPPLNVIYWQEARGVLVVHVVRSEQRLRATKLTQ